MRPSADYALVENGKVVTKPGPLPNEHGGHKGLRSYSHEKLVEAGWLPVEYECPRCKKDIIYTVDKKRNVIKASPSAGFLTRLKSQHDYGSMNYLTEQLLGKGFEFDGGVFYGDNYTIDALLTGLALGREVSVFARTESFPNGVEVTLQPDKVRQLLNAFLDAYQEVRKTSIAFRGKILAAMTEDEIYALEDELIAARDTSFIMENSPNGAR